MTPVIIDLNQVKNVKEKIIGLKQTLRAVQQDRIKTVCVANDLEEYVLNKVAEQCLERAVPLIRLPYGQKELGRACNIEVGAAVVALLK